MDKYQKASVIKNIRITTNEAVSEIRHIELKLDNNTPYSPGDSLAIYIKDTKTDRMKLRLYSIASSPTFHKNIIHITVKLVQYYDDDYNYFEGICSGYLSRLSGNDIVLSNIKIHKKFRLPVDTNKPIIMIGPGVGFAPFRSFIFERVHTNAKGINWLFFGNPTRKDEYIYQEELEGFEKKGLLKLSTAFSRDQKEKRYVQHLIEENSLDFFNLVHKDEAYIYVCGDKKNMSVAVEQAILNTIIKHHNKNQDEAVIYLDNLKTEGRYLKSVY